MAVGAVLQLMRRILQSTVNTGPTSLGVLLLEVVRCESAGIHIHHTHAEQISERSAFAVPSVQSMHELRSGSEG